MSKTLRPLKRVIGIDPSSLNCGVAFLDLSQGRIDAATLRIHGKRFVERFDHLYVRVRGWLGDRITMTGLTAVIEFPTFQNSAKGIAAAVSGDTLKLAATCGYLLHMFNSFSIETHFVTPQQWKGMLSKEETTRLLYKHPIGMQLKDKGLDHNALDAAAIATAWIEKRSAFDAAKAKFIKAEKIL